MSRRWKVLATVAMASCFTSGWLLQRQLAAGGDVYQQARLFESVLAHVRDYHVDSIPEPELQVVDREIPPALPGLGRQELEIGLPIGAPLEHLVEVPRGLLIPFEPRRAPEVGGWPPRPPSPR